MIWFVNQSGGLDGDDYFFLRGKLGNAYVLITVTVCAWERMRLRMADDLKSALNKIDDLEGTLTTCAFCKSIRDSSGNWLSMEAFVSGHSRVEFSHGYCPQCVALEFDAEMNLRNPRPR